MVDTGTGDPVQVVCGAPNARTGMKSVFSPPGTFIPGKDITLGVGHHPRRREPGHAVLGLRARPRPRTTTASSTCRTTRRSGVRYAEWAGLGDAVIDVAVTPNRPDALGVHGIARDLAAAGLGTLIEKPAPAGDGRLSVPDWRTARSGARATSSCARPSACASCAA